MLKKRQTDFVLMQMAAYFGVHVGNSSVCLAICKDEDRVEVVANDVGDRITPALLQWTPSSCIVGKTAQLELFRNSTNTITRNKQLLNDKISEEELKYLRSQVPYKINKVDSCLKYELLIDGKQFHVTPTEIAGWIFKKTLSIAESAVGGNKEMNVVITVPLYFSEKSIQLVREVAKKSGFTVIQVADEPAAAALGCGLGLNLDEPPYYCLVFRVGGYSIDATILMVHDGMFSLIHSVHKNHLGGALFTEKLFQYLESEFRRQYRSADITQRGKYKLYAAAETIKQVLSIQNVAHCSCESVGSGYDFNCSVSRARFENLVASLIPDIIAPIMEVIDKSNLGVKDIKKVVTCGGTLKTPKLQETVQKLLPTSEMINSCPDETIALGAAMQAGYCSRFDQYPNTLSVDVPAISTALHIKVQFQENEEIIFSVPKCTCVPIRKQYKVSSSGEELIASLWDSNNTQLGVACLSNLEPQGSITLDLDINKEGRILLTILDDSNGEKSNLKYDLNEAKEL